MKLKLSMLYERLNYCKLFVESLDRRLQSLSRVEVETVLSEDLKDVYHVLRNPDQAEWIRISFDISTAAHHLRSILDNLAYEVVTSENACLTERERRGIYFPILETEKGWHSSAGARLIRKNCREKYLQKFLDLQPFRESLSWTNASGHPLNLLSAISNQDKRGNLAISYVLSSEISTECTVYYHLTDGARQPETTFFEGVISKGEIESNVTIKRFSGPVSVPATAIIGSLRMPVADFITELVCNVEAIVEEFEELGELMD